MSYYRAYSDEPIGIESAEAAKMSAKIKDSKKNNTKEAAFNKLLPSL